MKPSKIQWEKVSVWFVLGLPELFRHEVGAGSGAASSTQETETLVEALSALQQRACLKGFADTYMYT